MKVLSVLATICKPLLFKTANVTIFSAMLRPLILNAVLVMGMTLASKANAQQIYDPLEPYNRAIYKFNSVIDYYALEPIARGYRYVVPRYGRVRIDNFLDNLSIPISAVNSLLQGDLKNTGDTIARFALNSTFGLFGFYDLASYEGIKVREEDFGQTLAVYGLKSGPFVMLPLLGPSTARDTAGRMIDGIALDPVDYAIDYYGVERERWIVRGVRVINYREKNIENIEALRNGSVDPYVSLRSAYLQKRENEILNGRGTERLDDAFSDAYADTFSE